MTTKLGWHFVGDKLRDGQDIPPDGEWLAYDGEVKICSSGLHYSERIIDALQWAPGSTICRVEVDDIVDTQDDKGVARKRKILWRIDGEELLREFARLCALDVAHLWDAPEIVVRYLKTGDDSLRESARAFARSAWSTHASRAAAREAAWSTHAATQADAQAAAWAAWAATQADAQADAQAAWSAQNRRLTAMVVAAHRKYVK